MRQGAPPRHGSPLYCTNVYDRTCGIASPPVHALPVLFLGSFRILPPSPGRHTQHFWTFRSTIRLLRQLGQKSYCEQPRGNHVLPPALAAMGPTQWTINGTARAARIFLHPSGISLRHLSCASRRCLCLTLELIVAPFHHVVRGPIPQTNLAQDTATQKERERERERNYFHTVFHDVTSRPSK